MASDSEKQSKKRLTKEALRDSLDRAGKDFAKAAHARDGVIALHLSGAGGGEYVVHRSGSKVTVSEGSVGSDEAPRFEVFASAAQINDILAGEVNPRDEFLKGEMRVRGDLTYLSDLAVELGILEEPL